MSRARLRVYSRGLGQVVFPRTLSGDYSAPQEPVPARPVFPESVFGFVCIALPAILAPVLALLAWRRWSRAHPAKLREKFLSAFAPALAFVLFAGVVAAVIGMKGDLADTPLHALYWPPSSDLVDPDTWKLFLVAFACLAILMALLVVTALTALLERALLGASPKTTLSASEIDLAPLVGFAMLWVVISFFPVSNIPQILPTVRAERFWYYPIIGSSILLAIAFIRLYDMATVRRGRELPAFFAQVRSMSTMKLLVLAPAIALKTAWTWLRDFVADQEAWTRWVIVTFIGLFIAFQCFEARRHAFDYNDDLAFWDATRKAVPNSAKAHLNYSVMVGARGDLQGRYEANKIAYELSPEWPMASVYLGDTRCRQALGNPADTPEKARVREERLNEAVEAYLRGFALNSANLNLIALGLQCLWDADLLKSPETPTPNENGEPVEVPDTPPDAPDSVKARLQALANQYPGSWLKYLVDDTIQNGNTYNPKGVDPKYRPRGYNEGPKD